MKRLPLLALLLSLAVLLLGQSTSVPLKALRPGTMLGVLVFSPSLPSGYAIATIDAGLLDTTVSPPALKIGGPPINEKRAIFKLTAGQSALVLPDSSYIPASLKVHRNGLLQYVPDDYTVSGTTINLASYPGEAGDVVVADYRVP